MILRVGEDDGEAWLVAVIADGVMVREIFVSCLLR